ncbi:MAG TPA: hypothetical protein VKR32_06545 [Puia sp.]|nr:hypothetical protein [Puia sp.]
MKTNRRKIYLLLFCIAAGLCCIYVILVSVFGAATTGIIPNPVTIPYHLGKNFRMTTAGTIDSATYNRVEKFKAFLDSLKSTDSARYRNIVNTRPHLQDSINAFEKIYLNQLNK